MTSRVKQILAYLKSGEHKKARLQTTRKTGSNYKWTQEEAVEQFQNMMQGEKPVFIPGDRMGFYRYQTCAPGEMPSYGGNFVPNYQKYLTEGFDAVYDSLRSRLNTAGPEQQRFINNALMVLDIIFEYCERYGKAADGDLKEVLQRIPHKAPTSYYEALVMVKIISFFLHCGNVNQITFGRFDQYMYPFYLMDVKRGVSREDILELTEEFFLSVNFDGDLYTGMQLGDNGQSLMLGGTDREGNSCFTELSRICMEASMELSLIDPKINLRVSKDTPFALYRLGTQMTRQGLGFPQYSNDDIVIPGLLKLGYTPEEAYNYSVAACWEYIVPDSMDVPNIRTMNFPKVVNNAVHKYLLQSDCFDTFLQQVKKELVKECEELLESANQRKYRPNPLISLFLVPCIEMAGDYSDGVANHYNFGFHGAGIANAADALAAVKKGVFEDRSIDAQTLITALDANFENQEVLRNQLLGYPKMGNNDDYVDHLAGELMEQFCKCLRGMHNVFGGIVRPGTGSAMEYILSARNVSATADGRYAYTPFSSSFSPAITTRLDGPLSVIQSFTKFDMTKLVNGGPLTMEIHDTTFRNEYGVEKVAQLVKLFIEMGGQQLQLNAVNRERLLDAKAHPQNYPNLIVRVWGWSGYFNELEPEYQDHIIKRTEFFVG